MKELARRYAEALYEIFPEEEKLARAAASLRDCPELWEALISPVVRSAEKEAVLSRLPLPALAGEPHLLRFLQVLAWRGRMALLPEIVDQFHGLSLKGQNAAAATLTWARQPEAGELEKLQDWLCQKFQKSRIDFNLRLDPALLGGFTLEIEGVTYDQSIRGRLARLARHLEEGGICHEQKCWSRGDSHRFTGGNIGI